MKISIITGASSGLGAEFSKRIYERNTSEQVWIIARREDRLVALKEQLGERCRVFALDLTKSESIDSIKNALAECGGEIDYLVNCAGYGKFGNYAQVSEKDNLGMIALNVSALVALTQAVLPYCVRGSKIVQISSVSAFMPLQNLSVYGASKAFVLNYSRALRKELKKKGIFVTAVCPGWTKTEFFEVADYGTNVNRPKKLSPLATVDKVVKKAIKGANKNKAVVTIGFTWWGFRLLCKLVPKSIAMALWETMQNNVSEE
ncbi:MAG: SDR family oxidoreductase [Clostridia bacterium]|nr:SDR family oxidoreductase [Clostridia bacterium]